MVRVGGKVAVPIHTHARALASLPRSLCTSCLSYSRTTHTPLIMFMSNFRVRDPLRPSFFELYAQQQLFPMLKPALHYAFSVRATTTPPHSRTCMVVSVSGRTTHTRTWCVRVKGSRDAQSQLGGDRQLHRRGLCCDAARDRAPLPDLLRYPSCRHTITTNIVAGIVFTRER